MKFVFCLFLVLILNSLMHAQQFTRAGLVPSPTNDSRSVNFIDVNNDGWDDLFISNGLEGGQKDLLYINDGSGSLQAIDQGDIMQTELSSVGASFADFDNNGSVDGFVTNWYGQTDQFFINDGDGVFASSDLNIVMNQSFAESASFGDYNHDGLLDLFVAASAPGTNQLFKNIGNGLFERDQAPSFLAENKRSRCINWLDINLDGSLDIFITNENDAANDLYYSRGNGQFDKLNSGSIVVSALSSMTSSWGDIDNDGDFDLFVGNAGNNQQNQLFENRGDIGFIPITDDPVIEDRSCTFGSNFGDIDNDGDLDLIVSNGFCNSNLSNKLYVNQGDGSFVDQTILVSGIRAVCSYGVAFGDIDNDGFLDLAIANCKNGQDAFEQSNDLFRNLGNENHWLKIDLHGVQSNRDAIGAVVRIKATIEQEPAWQMRQISAQSGYAGQNSRIAHFGLGDAVMIDSLIVLWPSGDRSTLTNVPADQTIKVIEGETTSIQDARGFVPNIRIYPNPANNEEINVEWDVPWSYSRPVEICVMDVLGNEVLRKPVDDISSSTTIAYHDLHSAGLYYVSVLGTDIRLAKKLILSGH